MSILTDRPIEALEQDTLGYRKFAEGLGEAIHGQDRREGIVIAIDAPWGGGKSSAVNMALKHLGALEDLEGQAAIERQRQQQLPASEKTHRSAIMRFEPWLISGQADLVAHFFEQLAPLLRNSASAYAGTLARKMKNALVTNASRFMGVAAVTADLLGMAVVANAATGLKDAVAAPATVTKSIQQLRAELRAELLKVDKRIVVVIDDVDRLPPDEMRQVLAMLKSVADLPCLVYLLPVEVAVVTQAMQGPTGERGISFVEKIVQVQLTLPRPRAQALENMLIMHLGSFGPATDDNELEDMAGHVVKAFISTPRAVVTLVNALRISWGAMKRDVYLTDLLGIEALRLFAPTVHQRMWFRSASLLANTGKTKIGETIDEIIKEADDERNPLKGSLLNVLLQLFEHPRTQTLSPLTAHRHARWVRDVDGFGQYFRWIAGDEAVTPAQLTAFEQALDDHGAADAGQFLLAISADEKYGAQRAAGILRALGEGRIRPEKSWAEALPQLLKVRDRLVAEKAKLEGKSTSWLFDETIVAVLQTVPTDDRYAVTLRLALSPDLALDDITTVFNIAKTLSMKASNGFPKPFSLMGLVMEWSDTFKDRPGDRWANHARELLRVIYDINNRSPVSLIYNRLDDKTLSMVLARALLREPPDDDPKWIQALKSSANDILDLVTVTVETGEEGSKEQQAAWDAFPTALELIRQDTTRRRIAEL